MTLSLKLFYLFLFSLSPTAMGAACCGGGISAPALIAGDEKAQLTVSYGASMVHADVSSDGLWHKRSLDENINDLRLEGAHLLSDRWQAGASVPLLRREREHRSSTGLGDLGLNVGYEYLPDWDYHPYRPKGLGYAHLTAPTGRAVQESEDVYQLSARGRGFWALGLGTLLSKNFGRFDTSVNLEGHCSFARNFSNSQTSGRLVPGCGAVAGAGGGYNRGDWRLGGNLIWTLEDAVDAEGSTPSKGSAQRYVTALFSVSRTFHMEWSATLSYSDQTLFGQPANTSLSRGFLFVVQRRWLR